MPEAETIRFLDEGNKQEAAVIVRSGQNHVAICVTLRNDGDLEVFLSKKDTHRLIEALQKAVGLLA